VTSKLTVSAADRKDFSNDKYVGSRAANSTMTTGIMSVLSNKITLPESLDKLSSRFKNARPYPHIFIDNMFPDKLLDQLVAERPSKTNDHWVHEDDENIERYNLRSAVDLGETAYQLAAFLHSAGFLYFLSELTGIWQLLPDPYLQGGGYHMIPRGGKFEVHSDRNTAYETGLTRRLALIIYLNRDWKHEYGGQFELWNSDGTRQEAVVEPSFNRTVIFEVAEKNFHGVPQMVACPNGRSRDSFLVYYHTAVNSNSDAAPHTSIYAPSFYGRKKSAMRSILRDITPPIIQRTLKKVRHWKKRSDVLPTTVSSRTGNKSQA
jgi:Rps23 Pro-64 3,4-dihydroxylase Tpa1-like proline 4-hydroxylase